MVMPAGLIDTDWFGIDDKKPRTQPSSELRGQLYLSNVSVLDSCPTVRTLLRKRAVKFGESAVKLRNGGRRTQTRNLSIMYISLPVLSADGREAVIGVESGGGIWTELLQQQWNGSWKRIAQSSGAVF